MLAPGTSTLHHAWGMPDAVAQPCLVVTQPLAPQTAWKTQKAIGFCLFHQDRLLRNLWKGVSGHAKAGRSGEEHVHTWVAEGA